MKPQEVLELARLAGLTVRVNGVTLAYRPAERMTSELRGLLVAHKPQLIALLNDAHRTTADLIEAAMRACDFHGDDEAGREAMRRDCCSTPPELRADLLKHFRSAYPRTRKP